MAFIACADEHKDRYKQKFRFGIMECCHYLDNDRTAYCSEVFVPVRSAYETNGIVIARHHEVASED